MKEENGGLWRVVQAADKRLAEEAAEVLAAMPNTEFCLRTTVSADEPPEDRTFRGRVLFEDLPLPPLESWQSDETASCALLEDGNLLFWAPWEDGSVLVDGPLTPDLTLDEATREVHPVAWMVAMRLLGRPLTSARDGKVILAGRLGEDGQPAWSVIRLDDIE